jgi:serine protease Do
METQRFCRYCGYRLDQSVQDYIPTETLNHATSPIPSPTQAPWMMPTPTGDTRRMRASRRRRNILIVLAGLALAGVIGGGIVSRIVPDRFERRGGPPVTIVAGSSYMGVYFNDEGEFEGAFIDGVVDGTPADQAGLIGGDLIIEAYGRPIRSRRDMSRLLGSLAPGTEMPIKVMRDGQVIELVLTTGSERDSGRESPDRPHGFFGIDPGELERVRIADKNIWGVQLNDVLSNDPADIAGIREGDIVIEFNGHPIRTPRELLRRINQSKPYEPVEVKVVRRGEELTIPVRMGRND